MPRSLTRPAPHLARLAKPLLSSRAFQEVGLSLLLSFSAVTLALSEPVFDLVKSQPEYLPIPLLALLALLLVYQILPFVAVFALDRLFSIPRLSPYASAPYRFALLFLASLSFVRQIEGALLGIPDAPVLKALSVLAILAGLAVLCWRARRAVTLFYLYCSPLALLFTVLFLGAALAPPSPVAATAEGRAARSAPMVPGPVFILLFDMLGIDVLLTPEGEIDRARFPHLAALADDGVWFTNATSNAFLTCDSVPTILTGRFVSNKWARCFQREGFQETNVLSRLSNHYQVLTSSASLSYCYDVAFTCLGGSRLSGRYPSLFLGGLLEDLVVHLLPGTGVGQWMADSLALSHRWSRVQFEELLSSITPGTTAEQLYYHHSNFPHNPFIFDEKGGQPRPVTKVRVGSPEEVYRLYGVQAQFVDLLLGRFIERLRALGLYEQATIVVTADHGLNIGMGDDPRLPSSIIEAARITLLIKSPRLKPGISNVDYQHIDFSNTLLDVLGLPLDEGADGVSAFAPQRPVREKVFYRAGERFVYDRENQAWHPKP